MDSDRRAPAKPAMIPELVATAKRLRAARAACRHFLTMWALDQAAARICDGSKQVEAALADPQDHDWSILYRGSVLDD
jgi:hypothetical protein